MIWAGAMPPQAPLAMHRATVPAACGDAMLVPLEIALTPIWNGREDAIARGGYRVRLVGRESSEVGESGDRVIERIDLRVWAERLRSAEAAGLAVGVRHGGGSQDFVVGGGNCVLKISCTVPRARNVHNTCCDRVAD